MTVATAGTATGPPVLAGCPGGEVPAARLVAASWPVTGLDRDRVTELVARVSAATETGWTRQARRGGLPLLLDWLEEQPGRAWQERWLASGADDAREGWAAGPAGWLRRHGRYSASQLELMTGSFLLLVGADIVRPSLAWLLTGGKLRKLGPRMARLRDPAGFGRLRRICEDDPGITRWTQAMVQFRVAVIAAAKGGVLADITVGDVLEALDAEKPLRATRNAGAATFRVLRVMGVFAADTPTLREIRSPGQRTAGEPAEVQTLPRAGDLVRRPRPDMITAAMGFPPDPDGGLHVGYLHGDASIPVTVVNGAVQRHVLIVGGIGSGKSYTRGVLGEELCRLGVPQVNIDVNGEMIDAAREMSGRNVRPGKGFTLPLGSLTREDLLEAVSGVNRGTNIETLIGYTFDSLRREIARGRRPAFSVDDFVAEIEVQAPILKMDGANTLRPAQQRVKALDRLNYIGPQFDWKGALQPGAFINIDCRSLLLRDLRIVTAAIARNLQDLARQREIPFAVLSIDEFHLVAPNDDKMVSTQVLREIARIGRHYRLGLILTTQSPSDVDRAVLKRLLTRFVHTIEPDQLDALRGIFADAPPEMIHSLPKLPRGTCVLTGVAETVRHATVIDIRSRVTSHGGATPDVFGDLRARGWPGKKPLTEIIQDPERDGDSGDDC